MDKYSIIKEAENNFAEYTNNKHAIMVNSGTSALHTAYLALGIKHEDEVIVPAFTYTSTVNMVLACGATPVFVDISPEDYIITLENILEKLTHKTKAVVLVNLFGKESKEIRKIEKSLKELNVFLVIDSAQCIKPKINYGNIQCFSFHRSKNFSCFEGGAITTNDDELNKEMRIIMNQGEQNKYHTIRLGFNYRMSDLQATMINHQITQHNVGGEAELERWGTKHGHYPLTVYQQPLYVDLGLYHKYQGICPVAERITKEVRNEIPNSIYIIGKNTSELKIRK